MNRRRKSPNSGGPEPLPTINYDLVSNLFPENSNFNKMLENESIDVLREKLQIKSEALNLLGKQLELCNKEKQEYKQLIDMLYDKNLTLKKNVYLLKENNNLDILDDENFLSETNHSNTPNLSSINNNKAKNLRAVSPNAFMNNLVNDIDSNVIFFKIF
jgi:hypothetical protein